MFAPRIIARAVVRQATCLHATRSASAIRKNYATVCSTPLFHVPASLQVQAQSFSTSPAPRAAKTPVDEIIEEITDLYGTARDEFEIATEETEKHSTYAPGDREAAREELAKLKERYEEVLAGEFGEEVKRRVGGRIRELDAAVENLNKADYED